VELFYVISAFALMHSTRVYRHEPDWISRFYSKRFWRIAPLFYVMIAVWVIYDLVLSERSTSPLEILANVTFVFNLIPEFSPSIVRAGWSVGVEMLFYALFPLAFFYFRSLIVTLAALALSIVVAQSARLYLDHVPTDGMIPYGAFSIVVHMPYFIYGIAAYQIYERLKARVAQNPSASILNHGLFAALTIVLLAIIGANNEQLRSLHRFDMALWGAVFATLAVWVTARNIPGLGWAPIQYLGERSYSLYLNHALLLPLTGSAVQAATAALAPTLGAWSIPIILVGAYMPVVALSMLTYAWIEKPGMNLGKKLRRPARAIAPAPTG
jgi:peptidoglycan/LPS O-acetylase OafA/YrhL